MCEVFSRLCVANACLILHHELIIYPSLQCALFLSAGMNLLDLRSKQWSAPVVAALPSNAAADLPAKLGPAAPSHAVVGTIAPYFTFTYGFNPAASVVAWSGDNPCSVAGLGLRAPGDIAVSLGTSDTMFGILAQPSPGTEVRQGETSFNIEVNESISSAHNQARSLTIPHQFFFPTLSHYYLHPQGHIFANPVDPSSYMAMLCYKNGSLCRCVSCLSCAHLSAITLVRWICLRAKFLD